MTDQITRIVFRVSRRTPVNATSCFAFPGARLGLRARGDVALSMLGARIRWASPLRQPRQQAALTACILALAGGVGAMQATKAAVVAEYGFGVDLLGSQ